MVVMLLSCSKSTEIEDKPDPGPNPGLEYELVYLPGRTGFVAVNNKNVILRGNFPIDSNGTFAYEQIMLFAKDSVPSVNFDDHCIIDVSLLDNVPTGEGLELNQELYTFSLPDSALPSHWPPYEVNYEATLMGDSVCGHPGKFMWWPIEGYDSSLSWQEKVGVFITNQGNPPGTGGGYNFDGLVDRIDSLFKDESYPKVIYIHCCWGADRTGALTFGWLVKHNQYDKPEAMSKVNSIVTPNQGYVNLMNDYYTWLYSKD